MPAKEIKELRQAGKLADALKLAKTELEANQDNVWSKRNISWVFYDYLKHNNSPEHFDSFIFWLKEINELHLPIEEKMLFEQLSWQIGKMAYSLLHTNPLDSRKAISLFETVLLFHFSKPSEGYSFLFKAMHKLLKDTDYYLQFADWWDFKNFMPEDFQKEKLPDGKEVMAIVEQAYITYCKHLLPRQTRSGEVVFNKEKVIEFLPFLAIIVENHPKFQYPAYFNAKLLLALGDKGNILQSLLPFAKKRSNDFWVWEILAGAFSNEEDIFACYCKALSCKSPEAMLVNLRQKMAGLLITRKLNNEARTEIDLLVKTRNEHEFKIPNEVIIWQTQEWYKNASCLKSNISFYKKYITFAESLLYSDIEEETVIVEFVNSDKNILNFIASESKFGFFQYTKFFKNVTIGETLKVRFQGGANGGRYEAYTAIKVNDEAFKKQFLKDVSGSVKIPIGKAFGFLDDVFIHPSLISKMKLQNGNHINGIAIKSYNQEKRQWSWKLI